jgi:hypothetical protein
VQWIVWCYFSILMTELIWWALGSAWLGRAEQKSTCTMSVDSELQTLWFLLDSHDWSHSKKKLLSFNKK